MSSVEFREISKRFGQQQLFSRLNLQVDSAKLTVILGPSGCGKSTLLRLIAGLEYPDSGAILIDNRDVTRREARKRGAAMVFQNYALYPHLTVRENLSFPLRVAKMPKPEIATRVAAAAELLGLAELLDRYPKTLSGGERQRTAVGRAIVREPRIFLFDEPLSNLDYQLRNRMRGELVSLQRTLKKTVIYVTHDQTEGMTMADTLVLMDKGRIMQIGAPGDVYRFPANLFVAGFIGAPPMNIFPARYSNGRLQIGDPQIRLDSPKLPEGVYQVGLRPNDLRASDSENDFFLVVDHTEFHGSENYIFGHHGDLRLTARAETDARHQRGDRVGLTFDLSALHLFDSQTGQRLNPAFT